MSNRVLVTQSSQTSRVPREGGVFVPAVRIVLDSKDSVAQEHMEGGGHSPEAAKGRE